MEQLSARLLLTAGILLLIAGGRHSPRMALSQNTHVYMETVEET